MSASSRKRKRSKPTYARSMPLSELYQLNINESKSSSQYIHCIDCHQVLRQNGLKVHYKRQHPQIKYVKKWKVLKR